MSVRIIHGDVRERLRELPADHFDCIVTSPPYFGLRSYLPDSHPLKIFEIGLEPTLDAYLETIVAICRELRRVLKPTGVFFLNIGDSYAGSMKGSFKSDDAWKRLSDAAYKSGNTLGQRGRTPYSRPSDSFKPKDLYLIPERLGIALQADGWWVRSHIIWAKKNCMPESCTDRPTSAHETVWMLTKSARYFWDTEAVKEEAEYGYSVKPGMFDRIGDAVSPPVRTKCGSGPDGSGGTRNIRNVWHMASQPFSGAHFATMPTELVERCIKAGSSVRGCCAACGKPWVRVVESNKTLLSTSLRNSGNHGRKDSEDGRYQAIKTTVGWQPSCKCPASEPLDQRFQIVPARILDPFAGAGTTGLVADRLGRDCTLIDLNTEYAEMALNRIKDDCPMFTEVAAE